MNQGRWNHLIYFFILCALFGMLYLIQFLIPHYEPQRTSHGHTEVHEIKNPVEESTEKEEPSLYAEPTSAKEEATQTDQQPPEATNDTNTEAFFTELKRKYQTNVLNSLTPGRPRSDIIIRYYKHPPDGDKVYSLKDLGFYIHERPIESAMSNYESNSIFYGDNVNKEDLMIVAYTLIDQGIPIKNITPSIYHDDWKNNAIEIGADSTVTNRKAMTLDQLREKFN